MKEPESDGVPIETAPDPDNAGVGKATCFSSKRSETWKKTTKTATLRRCAEC